MEAASQVGHVVAGLARMVLPSSVASVGKDLLEVVEVVAGMLGLAEAEGFHLQTDVVVLAQGWSHWVERGLEVHLRTLCEAGFSELLDCLLPILFLQFYRVKKMSTGMLRKQANNAII